MTHIITQTDLIARFGNCQRRYYLPARPYGFALFRLYFKLQAVGVEHLPKTGPGILVPNHASFLDPPLLSAVTPRVIYYLMLAHHYYHRRWHWLFSRLPCIPLKRGRAANTDAMKLCLHVLEHGQMLCMFPEGGIAHHHKAGGARHGATVLASRSGAPILPVGIQGADQALRLGQRWPRPKPITIRFGAPIAVPALDTRDKEALQATTTEIMNRVHALHTGV
jgi:1-acyl-sn-glycerol-3-phosphate acyltransferase